MQLKMRLQPRPYTFSDVQACPSMSDAIKLSARVAGLEPGDVPKRMEIDSGHWSRIMNGGAHFPHDRFVEFMEVVGNRIVLEWLAWKCGYGLVLLEDEKDRRIRELEARLEQERVEREAITKFMKEVKG